MTIDASAVARVLGIDVQYQDMRAGSVLFLPQMIAVFAQGASGVSYSLEKWQATSAGNGGSRYGFGSLIHLILRELLPANGDGVGTIPVWVIPLEDHEDGVAAEGGLTVSGTATRASTVRIRAAGILSEALTVPKGAVNASSVYAAIARAVAAVLEMPVYTTHAYGTVSSAPKAGGNTGNGTVTALSAPGNPVPGQWTLALKTVVANGGVFRLIDPQGTVVNDNVAMTPGAGTATPVTTGGLQFTLTDGSTDFAAGDSFTITVPATDVSFVAKWAGPTGNEIDIEVVGEDVGLTWTITQPAGGVTGPSITAALARVGTQWISMAINGAAPVSDETILDEFQTWGDGRWGEVVHKPLVVFSGSTSETVEDGTATSSGRRDDKINSVIPAPGSPNLPAVVAARAVARMAKLANNNPPTDYGSQRLTGIIPGADGVQWDYLQRDQAVKAGSSTTEVRDGVVTLGDVVTFYRPTGEEPPAYRFVKDIVRLQNIIYNYWLEFSQEEWDGAPLIPDDQPTVNPRARKPKHAVTAAAAITDSLGEWAIISDPEKTKENTVAAISSSNPNRLDMTVPVQLSGNTNVKALEIKFGFYFGAAAVVG